MDNGLEEIRKRKIGSLQQQAQKQAEEENQLKAQIQQLEEIVRRALTKEALQRYGNLKTAHLEKAVQLLVVVANAIQAQNIKTIDDKQLKEILMMMDKKHETKIRFK
ncbi:MAG: DNA-binding protein [Candidatus Woesearchaeota archaeon]|nr:DNA-binding protein [Candidatus Woesearchaeota archaeon]